MYVFIVVGLNKNVFVGVDCVESGIGVGYCFVIGFC